MKCLFLNFLAVLFITFLLGACGEEVRVSHFLSVKTVNWDLAKNEFVTVNVPIANFAVRLDLEKLETSKLSSSTAAILARSVLINPIEFMTITSLQTFEKRKPDSVLNDLFAIGETLLVLDSLNKQNRGNYYRSDQLEYYLKPLKKISNSDTFQFIIQIKTQNGAVLKDTTDKIFLK